MKFVRFLILFLFVLCIHVPIYAQQLGPFTVKQKDYVDLNGDGKKEVIELFTRKDQDYEHEWKLVVDGKEIAVFDDKGTYRLAEMKFDDLLNDGKKEILLDFVGGFVDALIVGHVVFKQDGDKFTQIFTDPIPKNFKENYGYYYHEIVKKRFSMKYLGNSQVEFIDKQTGLETIIPLKERYGNYPTQEEVDKVLQRIKTCIRPIQEYRIVEVGKNKPKEIGSIQQVCGTASSDIIALYETRYVFNNKTQKYEPSKVALYSEPPGPKKKLGEKPYR